MEYNLLELRDVTNEICDMAYDARDTFVNADIDWAEFGHVSAEYYTNEYGGYGYRVYIEEANPDNMEVQDFIEDGLELRGFENIEVVFEW